VDKKDRVQFLSTRFFSKEALRRERRRAFSLWERYSPTDLFIRAALNDGSVESTELL